MQGNVCNGETNAGGALVLWWVIAITSPYLTVSSSAHSPLVKSRSGSERFGSLSPGFDSSRYFAEIHDCPKLFEKETKAHIRTAQKSVFRVDPFILKYPSRTSVPCGLHLLFQPRFPLPA